MKKTQVLLIFGGQSSEHEVSLMSAKNVFNSIDSTKFTVKLAFVDKTGKWFAPNAVTADSNRPLGLDLVKQAFVQDGLNYRPDVILPILHGANGEDGLAAAIGQLLNIPVVGCDMTASAVAMDKLLAKQVAEQNQIPIVPYLSLRRSAKLPGYVEIKAKLGATFFVKPTRAGSSVGVSRVTNQAELDEALRQAFQYDDMVLLEQAIVGRELEVAVLGNDTDLTISPVGEILVSSSDDFYSYESKYASDSKTSTTTKAELAAGLADEIRALAGLVYQSLRCAGLARVDFFCVGEKIYFNEINTLPGFTNISMYPKLMEESGLSQQDLVTRLIELALE